MCPRSALLEVYQALYAISAGYPRWILNFLPVMFCLCRRAHATLNILHDSWQHSRKYAGSCAMSLGKICQVLLKISRSLFKPAVHIGIAKVVTHVITQLPMVTV
ncbi:hypothetical protein AVEN_130910-1 [Araneus ventricosus]|uniref:Uncharacterized protein n=1 Tax=Araneus ventricosus TaxID=182803 RepID=A0A4Y2RJ01_ARAVE|nr:hypothetical protein AVEN_130910-1 [Araneus ventricosus]